MNNEFYSTNTSRANRTIFLFRPWNMIQFSQNQKASDLSHWQKMFLSGFSREDNNWQNGFFTKLLRKRISQLYTVLIQALRPYKHKNMCCCTIRMIQLLSRSLLSCLAIWKTITRILKYKKMAYWELNSLGNNQNGAKWPRALFTGLSCDAEPAWSNTL